MGTSSFTFGSVSVGSGSKVGNTVEVTGFTTGNPAITVQFTALGTYSSVKAKSTKIDGTYGDSDYSSTDSILIYEQLSAPSLNAPADSDDATAVTYTISSIDSNATKVIFDTQSSNFTYGSVGSGSGSKVGNTVEITGWSGTSVTVTLTYTTAATYSNRAKVQSTADAYTDSAYSSTDSIIISSPAVWYGSRATWSGGGGDYVGIPTNIIDYVTIATTSNATDFGNLTQSRHGAGGVSNATRGVISSGHNNASAYYNIIDYITISTTGNATDFGDSTYGRYGAGGASDGSRGVFGSGHTGSYQNALDYITIATTSNATDFGDALGSYILQGGASNSIRGLFFRDNTSTNSIEYVTIQTTGNTTDFGDLSATRANGAPVSDSSRCVYGGGDNPSGQTNIIDYVTVDTTGNATDFGDLTTVRAAMSDNGNSDGTTGIWGGGNITGVHTDVIDYVTIQTTGNATDFGNLSGAGGRFQPVGNSGN
jgi:hypothetical protein